MRKPNLFIIGAMKSGTTSLHQYLSEHPDISMSTFKEPSYFLTPEEVRDVYFEAWAQGFWKSENTYLALFPDADKKTIIGESSTNYTKMNKVTCCAEKIKTFNPDAKFIYLMRDPVHRTISHYFHEFRRGEEKKGILQALAENPYYIETSDYAFQLAPFMNVFDRSRFLFLTTEAMQRDPRATYRQVCEWLGVDAAFLPPSLGSRVHETPEEMLVPRGGAGKMLIHAYHLLKTHTGLREPKALRAFLMRMVKRPTQRSETREQEEIAIRYLRPIMQEKVARLVPLIGRDFPEWRTLAAAGETVSH